MKLVNILEVRYDKGSETKDVHPLLKNARAAKIINDLRIELQDMYSYGLEGMGPDWEDFPEFVLYEEHNHAGVSNAVNDLFELAGIDESHSDWEDWEEEVVELIKKIASSVED